MVKKAAALLETVPWRYAPLDSVQSSRVEQLHDNAILKSPVVHHSSGLVLWVRMSWKGTYLVPSCFELMMVYIPLLTGYKQKSSH